MQGFDEKQCFSYDFSHGVGQSARTLVRCDAEQGSAAAHFGGHEDPNESDMGAKWEPNAVKMLTNIVAKFAIDLGGHFGVQKVSKGLPKGGNTGGKIEAKSLQEATCAEKAETVKIALAPPREH